MRCNEINLLTIECHVRDPLCSACSHKSTFFYFMWNYFKEDKGEGISMPFNLQYTKPIPKVVLLKDSKSNQVAGSMWLISNTVMENTYSLLI